MRLLVLLLPCSLLASCATYDELNPGDLPVATLVDRTGASAGWVAIEQRASGPFLRISAENLTPGEHGIHLHSVGRCDGPDFQSSGTHWNPTGRKHGHLNPEGAHIGDLPNLTVSANGHGSINFLVSQALADADGTSLVIHAGPDDYKTDPSGNSGDRIACAVIAGPMGQWARRQ